MNESPHEHSDVELDDPFAPGGSAEDPLTEWASELRTGLVAEMAPAQVTTVAGLAASATVASTASLAAAGSASAAGSVTGGHTMLGFITTATGKFIAGATLVASLGTG